MRVTDIQYTELPEVLWAATGIRMQRVDQYQAFGRLRNASIHFAVPQTEDWQGDRETVRIVQGIGDFDDLIYRAFVIRTTAARAW